MKHHACKQCIADGATTAPRPITWCSPSGRVQLCKTHERARVTQTKTNNHSAYVARTYGISRQEQERLWEFQGKRCPCGRQPSRFPDTDHNHRLARQHNHDVDKACPECMRGLLCRYCNHSILGMGYTADMLRALADYLDNPPYQQMRKEKSY